MNLPSIEVVLIWLSYLTAVAATASWVVTGARRASRRSIVRRFFGASEIVVFLPLRMLGGRKAVDEADFAAGVQLSRVLASAGVQVEFKYVAPDGSLALEDKGVVAICGPKSSPIVAKAISDDPRLGFSQDSDRGGNWVISDRRTGVCFTSPLDSNAADRDIAYIARLPQRPESKHTFIVIAGIHSQGSAGVVDLISNRKALRDLHRATRNRYFSGVVRSTFLNEPFRVVESDLRHLVTGPATPQD